MLFRREKEKIIQKNKESGKYLKKMTAQLSKGLENSFIDEKTKKTINLAREMISAGDLRPLSLLIQTVNRSNIFYNELREYFRGLGNLFFDFHKALIQYNPANLQNIPIWLSFYINSNKFNEFSHYLESISADDYTAIQVLDILLHYNKEQAAKAWISRLKAFDIADPQTGRNLDYKTIRASIQKRDSSMALLDKLEAELEEKEDKKTAQELLENFISNGLRKDIAQNFIQEIQKEKKLRHIESSDISQQIFDYLKWTQSKKITDWSEFNNAIKKINLRDVCELLSEIPPKEIKGKTIMHLIQRCFEECSPLYGTHYAHLELLDKIVSKAKNIGFLIELSDKGTKCNSCKGTGVVGANYDAPLDRDTDPGYPCATCKGNGGNRKIKISITSPEGEKSNWKRNTCYRFEFDNVGLEKTFKS